MYVFDAPVAGAVQLLRLVNTNSDGTRDHLYTTSQGERDSLLAKGWTLDSMKAYCMPAGDTICPPGYAGEDCGSCADETATYPQCGREPVPPTPVSQPTPQALQGHDDESVPLGMDVAMRDRRYEVLASMQPGIRRYNFFWSSLEPTAPPGAGEACPSGTVTFQGLRQHCYNAARLAKWDDLLNRDVAIGAQQAGIMYATPGWARPANCTGFPWGKSMYKNGCVPLPEFRDDWEDYIAFLTARYNGGANGKGPTLRHLVIWNEVADAGWMDCSGLGVSNRATVAGASGDEQVTVAEFQVWMEAYVDLMTRAYRAAVQNIPSVVLYVSTDRLWEAPKSMKVGQKVHVSVRRQLDYITWA